MDESARESRSGASETPELVGAGLSGVWVALSTSRPRKLAVKRTRAVADINARQE